MSYSVLITETVLPDNEIERRVFEEAGIEMFFTNAGSADEIIDAADCKDIDALLAASHIRITSAVFEELDGLQMLSSYGIGVDHIDIDAATRHGIPVTNVPDYAVEEVSTHALALLLCCVRSVVPYNEHVTEGGWEWEFGRPITRLTGQTLGLVAFGKIPRRLATKVNGFNFEVVSYDPEVDASEMREYGVEKVDFDELLGRSDLVSVHTPLTDETHHMFDDEVFHAMKDDAIFINTSRGSVMDEDALNRALEEDEIKTAGLDVMDPEPPKRSPLISRNDTVITPHSAWYSEQSREELQRKAAEEVVNVLQNRNARYLVNSDVEAEVVATTDDDT